MKYLIVFLLILSQSLYSQKYGIGVTYSNKHEVGVNTVFKSVFLEYRTGVFKGRQYVNGVTYPNRDSFSVGYKMKIDSLVLVPTINLSKIGNVTRLNWELKIRTFDFKKVALYTGFGSREVTITLIRKL